MIDSKYLRASNGSGDAIKAAITATRPVGSVMLSVDAITNFPDFFFATIGDLDEKGIVIPSTKTEVRGKLNGTQIEIEEFAPGSQDNGNTIGQTLVVRPNTEWANAVAENVQAVGLGKDISAPDKWIKFSTAVTQPAPDLTNDIIWFKPV